MFVSFLFTAHSPPHSVYSQSPPLECKPPADRDLVLFYMYSKSGAYCLAKAILVFVELTTAFSSLCGLSLPTQATHPPTSVKQNTRLPTLHHTPPSTLQPSFFQVTAIRELWGAVVCTPPGGLELILTPSRSLPRPLLHIRQGPSSQNRQSPEPPLGSLISSC